MITRTSHILAHLIPPNSHSNYRTWNPISFTSIPYPFDNSLTSSPTHHPFHSSPLHPAPLPHPRPPRPYFHSSYSHSSHPHYSLPFPQSPLRSPSKSPRNLPP